MLKAFSLLWEIFPSNLPTRISWGLGVCSRTTQEIFSENLSQLIKKMKHYSMQTIFPPHPHLLLDFRWCDPVLMNPFSQSPSIPLAEEICHTVSDMNADHVMVTQETLTEQLMKNYPGNAFLSSSFKSNGVIWNWVSDTGQAIIECLQAKLTIWKNINKQAPKQVKHTWMCIVLINQWAISLTLVWMSSFLRSLICLLWE